MRRRSLSSVRVFYPRFDRAELIRRLRERMAALKEALPLVQVVLFGSYARGNYTVASDIDLLVVYQGPRREEAFALVKRTLDTPGLEPHLYSEEEYRQAQERLARMTEGGLVLFPGPQDDGPRTAGPRDHGTTDCGTTDHGRRDDGLQATGRRATDGDLGD